jgi:hypothetical protein
VQVGARASLPSFTTSATSIGSNTYSQSLTGYSFGGSGTHVTKSSSIYNTGNTQPWKAFDNDITTWWETTGGLYNTLANGGGYTGPQTITIDGIPTSCEWITIQIPTGVVLLSYSMYARSGFAYRMPKNFKIAGSNDGATWTTVDTQTNQTTWTGQTPITFTVNSSTVYTYFALCVTAIMGVSSTQNLNVGQWTLNASWQTDFYADERGNLLTAPVTGTTLQNWLGGATGYVTTWYDQSGRGNHAIQNTAANQPIIQRATKGPGYACLFNGTTNFLTGMSYTVLNATNFSFNIVERRTGSSSGGTASNDLTLLSCGDIGATGKLLYLLYRNNTNSLFGSWSPEIFTAITAYNSPSEPIRYTSATASSTSGRRVYIYNDPLGNPISASDATQTSLMSMTSGNFQIGYYTFGSSTSYYKGEIYELLVFTQSLYDLDGTTSINQIYQNQLGAYGT